MQRTDLADLRVLLVGNRGHVMATLRAVLGVAGISRIVQAERPDRALDLLGMDQFAAVYCEHGSMAQDLPFAVAVRRLPSMLNPMIPIFTLASRAYRRDVEKARDLGATDVLTMPVSPRTLIEKLDAALAAPRPFILAPDFFGPDRRSRGREAFVGRERRFRVPRKQRIDFSLA